MCTARVSKHACVGYSAPIETHNQPGSLILLAVSQNPHPRRDRCTTASVVAADSYPAPVQVGGPVVLVAGLHAMTGLIKIVSRSWCDVCSDDGAAGTSSGMSQREGGTQT